ncbi:MAG: hypothetical protein GWN18_14245, partial [Thermoplasmata archaeon]|nr:hypothetical protein [Thermoplasmata archaeon]NIS13222.1 hypothetical protein [Thermoplasmata archaeon]NIS21114.1 hypothetical protein [Thermoplasmata archaeon]NIT76546.1 hypothetical protein [Thermoplasmata archaeon]NIU50165.1 hypothetical protein [Thermoplasmata archaeon]
EAFEDIEDFKPQLKIMSFDIENSLKDDAASKRQRLPGGRVFCISIAVRQPDGDLVTEALVDDDEE